MSGNVVSEMPHDCLIEALAFPVSLGMICSRRLTIEARTDSDYHKELGHKMKFVSGQKVGRNTVRDDPDMTNTVAVLVDATVTSRMISLSSCCGLAREFYFESCI